MLFHTAYSVYRIQLFRASFLMPGYVYCLPLFLFLFLNFSFYLG